MTRQRRLHIGWTLVAGIAAAVSWSTAAAADCTQTSVGRTPINDLGPGLYLGLFQGGLYPGGLNTPPAAHAAEGAARAAAVIPRDTAGNPSPTGKYVLLSIGMSNTTQEWCAGSSPPCAAYSFMGQAAAHPLVNHTTLVIIDGAAGGQTAGTWDQPTDQNYDRVRDQELAPLGLTEAQVQVAWVKVANAGPTVGLPSANAEAYTMKAQLGGIMRALKTRYPNIQIAFLSSRIYAGYASTTLNPEPYAYEYAFSMKWAIEAQINQMAGGPVDPHSGNLDYGGVAPWMAWGPYLWADGLTPRSDGLIWQCADLANDGTHPSPSGREKVADMLMAHMLNSPYAVPWFRINCPMPDPNNDGSLNTSDLPVFVSVLTGADTDPAHVAGSDANCDGHSDGKDIFLFVALLLGP